MTGKAPTWIVMAAVLAIALVPLASAPASHWCPPLKVSAKPEVFYPGETVRVALTLANGAPEALEVQELKVTFSWQQVLGLDTGTVAPGGEREFAANFTMGQTPVGTKSATVAVLGKTSVDWFAELCTKTLDGWPVVNERPPLAVSVVAPTTTAKVGESLGFEAVVAGGTPPYSANWTFGDGGSAAGMKVSHEYWAFGKFTVKVVVRDQLGRIAEATTTVTIPDPSGGEATPSGPDLVALLLLVVPFLLVGVVIGVAIGLRIGRARRVRRDSFSTSSSVSRPPPGAGEPAQEIPPQPKMPLRASPPKKP
jgi:hypothetical protein